MTRRPSAADGRLEERWVRGSLGPDTLPVATQEDADPLHQDDAALTRGSGESWCTVDAHKLSDGIGP